MMKLEGISSEVQRHIAGLIRDAGSLIQEYGKSYGVSVDSAGRICALEALSRVLGYGQNIMPEWPSELAALSTSAENYERFSEDPAVTAFAQFLLFTGRALLVDPSETYTQVISQWSDDHREDEVVEAFFACADSLEV
jgi:hypothetical protein